MKIFSFSLVALLISITACNSSKKTAPIKATDENFKTIEFVGFKATGNEPSWVVEIDFNNGIHFKSLDDNNFDITTKTPAVRKPQDISATNYKGDFEDGYIQVMVYHETCTDDMAGEAFDNKVRVSITNNTTDEATEYNGCGNYKEDYKLNDIWILTHIDDKEIHHEGLVRPSLEFNISEKRVSGFGGCNQISGNFNFSQHQIAIGQLTSTLMACLNQSVEDQFLGRLNDQKLNFEVGNNQLKLWNHNGSMLFRKGD